MTKQQILILTLAGVAVIAVVTAGGYFLGREAEAPLFDENNGPLILDEPNIVFENDDMEDEEELHYLPTIPPEEIPSH